MGDLWSWVPLKGTTAFSVLLKCFYHLIVFVLVNVLEDGNKEVVVESGVASLLFGQRRLKCDVLDVTVGDEHLPFREKWNIGEPISDSGFHKV